MNCLPRRLQSWVCGLITALGCLSAWGAARTVTIGAEDDWPPYSFVGPDGRLQGITPRLVEAALKTRGIDTRFQVLPFSRCMRDAQEGTLVACFNATITDDNRQPFQWHPTPLFVEELGIFAKTGAGPKTRQAQDLEGHTVGITRGYTYPSAVVKNPRIKIIEAGSDLQLMKLLRAGRLEFALLNTLPAYWRIQQDTALKGQIERVGAVSQDGFWMAVSRQHPDGTALTRDIEAGLKTLKASGDYDRLMQKARQELIR